MTMGTPPWTTQRFRPVSNTLSAAYDVVIVGAGYTGLHAALLLARAGRSVCVLERDRLIGAASARNAGFCTVNPPVPVGELLRDGEDVARAWVAWFAHAVDCAEGLVDTLQRGGADIGFRRVGNVRLAETTRQAERLSQQEAIFARLGAQRAFLRAEELDMPDAGHFVGGLRDRESAVLNPGRLHVALAGAAQEAGVAIFEGVDAQEIDLQAGTVSVSTARGVINAGKVLIATNGFTEHTIPAFRRTLLSVGSFLILTDPVPASLNVGDLASGRCHATSFRFPHYFRLTDTRQLLFGGRAGLEVETDLDACAAWLGQRVQQILPGLPDLAVAACWGGRLGFAGDKRPVLGRLNDHVYYAMGYAGHGVPTSLAVARDVARHMLGTPNPARAPFWREPGNMPANIPRVLKNALPLAQAGLRGLDAYDMWRDTFLRRKNSPILFQTR